MALCRLVGRNFLSKLPNYEKNMLMVIRPVTIKSVPHVPKPNDFEAENMRLGRPLSPHLTIYSPQLTSMLSITHRITGCMLSGYMFLLGASSVLPGNFVSHIASLDLGTFSIFFLKLAIAWPFAYHFTNGIRHLSWDMGKFLTIKEVYSTGWIMVAVSSALTVILAVL